MGHIGRTLMPERLPYSRRYECRWREENGRQVHYWVDHSPTEPHWPESAVMRWDLRQRDWDKIWPELIDHPCAILFAPNHPHRNGPRRFRDWVASWPETFAWATELPAHLHDAIRKAQDEIRGDTGAKAHSIAPEVTNSAEEGLLSLPPLRTTSTDELIERLVVVLLDIDDIKRPTIAQQLQVLALAPDSGRVVQSLKSLLAAASKKSDA